MPYYQFPSVPVRKQSCDYCKEFHQKLQNIANFVRNTHEEDGRTLAVFYDYLKKVEGHCQECARGIQRHVQGQSEIAMAEWKRNPKDPFVRNKVEATTTMLESEKARADHHKRVANKIAQLRGQMENCIRHGDVQTCRNIVLQNA